MNTPQVTHLQDELSGKMDWVSIEILQIFVILKPRQIIDMEPGMVLVIS
jgi:hypothetical protein